MANCWISLLISSCCERIQRDVWEPASATLKTSKNRHSSDTFTGRTFWPDDWSRPSCRLSWVTCLLICVKGCLFFSRVMACWLVLLTDLFLLDSCHLDRDRWRMWATLMKSSRRRSQCWRHPRIPASSRMTTSPFSKTLPTWPTGVDCRYLNQQILFPFSFACISLFSFYSFPIFL